uniref:Uncharacterized protein n=1 Tax=Panagrolaimus davidi TaxID=227884 RepID=A0A914QZC0_9BILA
MDVQGFNCSFNESSSDGLWNSNYGSYRNVASNDSFGTYISSSTNLWNNSNNTVSTSLTTSIPSLSNPLNLATLVEKAHDEVQHDIQNGNKPDFYKCKCKVCKWLKNPSEKSSSRGRPESEKEYENQNIWRNNWIYRKKKSMENEIKNAKNNEIFKTNESLNNQYFNLCLEYLNLWENLCPHNQKTVENIKQNSDYSNHGICICSENCQSGRF